MEYTRYRRHPRVYKKQCEPTNDTFDMTIATASGILAATFLGGAIIGYMVKKAIY